MPITTTWYNDQKRIILFVYEGDYSWNDVYNAAADANILADEAGYPVANIIDLTNAGSLPSNAASHGKRLRELRSSNIQFEVVVGANKLIKTLANVANSIFKIFTDQTSSHFVDTLDEALSLIEAEFLSKEV
jgi:hypothetical protein